MRRKILVGLTSGLFLLGGNSAANALSVAVTYTGDNVVDNFYLVDGGVTSSLGVGEHSGDWTKSDSLILANLLASHNYSFIWQMHNAGYSTPSNSIGGGDPAAFLAELTGDIAGGPLYSAAVAQWEYSLDGLEWASVTSYGNNGGNNIWTSVNLGKIQGVDELAQWIWSGNDDASIYLKANFQTTPVPEATTMLLFGIGLAGLASVIRKRRE